MAALAANGVYEPGESRRPGAAPEESLEPALGSRADRVANRARGLAPRLTERGDLGLMAIFGVHCAAGEEVEVVQAEAAFVFAPEIERHFELGGRPRGIRRQDEEPPELPADLFPVACLRSIVGKEVSCQVEAPRRRLRGGGQQDGCRDERGHAGILPRQDHWST